MRRIISEKSLAPIFNRVYHGILTMISKIKTDTEKLFFSSPLVHANTSLWKKKGNRNEFCSLWSLSISTFRRVIDNVSKRRRITAPEWKISKSVTTKNMHKLTIIFKLPESNLFSRTHPSGISILWPSLATTMTVPRRVTFRPKLTSPVTVKWSSSRILGIFLNLFWNCWI